MTKEKQNTVQYAVFQWGPCVMHIKISEDFHKELMEEATASRKKEMPKPKKADDAGARARRALKRKEYQAKVSVIVPPELED